MIDKTELLNIASRVPPFRPLLVWQYERRFRSRKSGHWFRGVFDTFDEAEASIPHAQEVGYDGEGAAAMYRDSIGKIRSNDYPVLFWLQKLLGSERTLFDLGGHVGVKFYGFTSYLDFSNLVWTVCDVPAVAKAGRVLAEERGVSGLRFTDQYNDGSGQDILLCSGSLQFLRPSLGEIVGGLAERPKHVLVNTTPLSDKPTYYTVNNIGAAFCPYKIINRVDMLKDMDALGYECVDGWENTGKGCPIPLHPEMSVAHYSGIYFRRR